MVAVALVAMVAIACDQATAPDAPAPNATFAVAGGRLFTADDAAAFAARHGAEFSLASLDDEDADDESDDDGDKTRCVGVLTGVFEQVVVPAGAECYLVNSVVRKHVTALENSALGIGTSWIGGDVKGKKASSVNVDRTTVGGDVAIHDGGPHRAYIEVFLCAVTLPKGNVSVHKMVGGIQLGPSAGGVFCVAPNRLDRGHLELKENVIPANRQLSVRGNQVGGDGKIYKNEGPGTKVVQSNTFAKKLDCKSNSAPFLGGPNVAQRTEGQCF